jgi:uncharacterized membrane protein
MKKLLLLCTSKSVESCLKEYLNPFHAIEITESGKKFNAIITEDPLSLKVLHQTYPEASLFLLVDPGHTPGDLSFPVKVFEKPFYLKDLKEVLDETTPQVLVLSFYKLYPTSRRLVNTKTQETESLTEKEVAILEYLYEHKNKPISREDLLKSVWNYSKDITTHTLETHIYRLRQKLQTSDGQSLLVTTDDGYELRITP